MAVIPAKTKNFLQAAAVFEQIPAFVGMTKGDGMTERALLTTAFSVHCPSCFMYTGNVVFSRC